MTKKERQALEATREYIQRIIDTTPWADAAQQATWCRSCPGRASIITESGLDSPCYACPLRPLLVALAELQLRQNRNARAAAAEAQAQDH